MHLECVFQKQSHWSDVFPSLYLMEYLTCGVNEYKTGAGKRLMEARMEMCHHWEEGPLKEPAA
jgi:hypothetical protein